MTDIDTMETERVTYVPDPPIVRFRPDGTGGGTITFLVERKGFRPKLITKHVNVYPSSTAALPEVA